MPRQTGAKEWAPDLSIVSDTNTCSIPVERRDAVTQNSAVSQDSKRVAPSLYENCLFPTSPVFLIPLLITLTHEILPAGI